MILSPQTDLVLLGQNKKKNRDREGERKIPSFSFIIKPKIS